MAKSEAKKKLMSRLRQGKPDPRALRGNWNGVNPVSRVKPNKKKENDNQWKT